MILNDSLNDIVVEYIKLFILSSLDNRSELDDIRYNGIDNENLTFTTIPDLKVVGIDMNIYNNILNNAKIKNKKEYMLIDEATYKHYIKVK